jgi:endonuclease IV
MHHHTDLHQIEQPMAGKALSDEELGVAEQTAPDQPVITHDSYLINLGSPDRWRKIAQAF